MISRLWDLVDGAWLGFVGRLVDISTGHGNCNKLLPLRWVTLGLSHYEWVEAVAGSGAVAYPGKTCISGPKGQYPVCLGELCLKRCIKHRLLTWTDTGSWSGKDPVIKSHEYGLLSGDR